MTDLLQPPCELPERFPRPSDHSAEGLARPPQPLGQDAHHLQREIGVWLTRNRNCFSDTGTNSTSVIAIAVALRGSPSISAISPKMLSAASSLTVRLPIWMRTWPLLITKSSWAS